MSESAIENYEKKAKQGILFGDSNLKGLYERMYNVFNPSGNDSNVLRNMGLTYSYSSDGTSTLTLDEKKLRAALDSDPDAVMNVFTNSFLVRLSAAHEAGQGRALGVHLIDEHLQAAEHAGVVVHPRAAAPAASWRG